MFPEAVNVFCIFSCWFESKKIYNHVDNFADLNYRIKFLYNAKLPNLVIYFFAGVIVGMQMSDILSWVLHVPYQNVDRNGYNLAEVSDIQNPSMCKNEGDMDYGHDIEHRIINSGNFKIEHTLPKLT